MLNPRSNNTGNSARLAEDQIAKILEQQQWTLLGRNFRRKGCEVDIIARKGNTLAFVEVKFRHREPKDLADLETLLPLRKRRSLQRGASVFVSEFPEACHCHLRFDLAVVFKQKQKKMQPLGLHYFVNAFAYDEAYAEFTSS